MNLKDGLQITNGTRDRQSAHRLFRSYEESVDATLIDMSQFNSSTPTPAEYYFQHAKRLYLDNLTLARQLSTLE